MRIKLAILLLSVLFCAPVFGQIKSIYEKTVDSLNQIGQPEKIIPYLEIEVKKQPKDETLLRLTGYQYLQLNNLERGEHYYRQALMVNPACARCYLNLGLIYAFKNDFNQALNYLDKAVANDSNDDMILSNRGRIKDMIGDKIGALVDYNKSISIAPDRASNYVERGNYHLNHQEKSKALLDFNKAIELDSKHYKAYFFRGRLKFENNDLSAALEDINQAISLVAPDPQLYNFRGTVYNHLKQFENALTDLNTSIQLNPNDVITYLNRAEIYYALEDLDASCQDYTTAKALALEQKLEDAELYKNMEESMSTFCDSSKASYYYQRGVAFYNLQQYEKALKIYDAGLRQFPDNAMILSFKGNAHLALKDFTNATLNYDIALINKASLMLEFKNNPRFINASQQELQSYYDASLADIYYHDAESKVNTGKLDTALVRMNDAIALIPNLNGFAKELYFNRRGHIYLLLGQYNQALVDFNQSIQINGKYALAYINRAIAKVSLSEKPTQSAIIIRTKQPNQPFRMNWTINSKIRSEKADLNLKSALADCNKAIDLDKSDGFSYYVRGQIKQFLNDPTCCADLLKAKKMGIVVEDDLLVSCNQ